MQNHNEREKSNERQEKKKKAKKFDYFSSLSKMAEYAVEEARLFKRFSERFEYEKTEELRVSMHAIERLCDEEKHEFTTRLAREFLPPIEREDLFLLSRAADDLADDVDGVAAFLYMADVKTLRKDAVEFAELMLEACRKTWEMLNELRNIAKPQKLLKLIVQVNEIEERGDKLYEKAVRALSKESRSTREVIEWRDIYLKFEKCFNAAESLADAAESAILKNS